MIGSDELQTYYRLDVKSAPFNECSDPESVPLSSSYGLQDYFIIGASMLNVLFFPQRNEPHVVGRLRKAILKKEKRK
ncbi:hypothetical protein J2755_001245 [Methanohalophilus levihalophilus]|uniref:hypothetical protein n=1 Tax=Methanohalophilus levihalophilus TaxID=1431282 RepID=UPI001AE954A3|nr:hypothetical protein [Methanohalophilus levihalophilus]MBP2030311.1 hypothetical protein [Methanohalophilus levihalophilus]